MKNLKSKKTMAAKVLNIGKNKVWLDPLRSKEIEEAITKQDIQDLINDKAIKKKTKIGRKRRSGRIKLKRKRKGRKRNFGKIKRRIPKKDYHKRIRKLRNFLKILKNENKLSNEQSRMVYNLLKAGELKNKQDISDKIGIKK